MKFNSWQEFIEAEKQKPYFTELTKKVESARSKTTVFPEKEEVFSCFTKCPLEKTKVVILGQDPYHSAGQAHGMSFSVRKGVKFPPSLRNIFKELNEDLGVEVPPHGFLEKWSEQGVLLLNTTLTVEEGKPASHADFGWREFSKNVLEFLNESKRPIVFVLWGMHAQKVGLAISNERHLKIESAHPSPFSARRGFFGSNPFSKANEFLRKTEQSEIDWRID